MSTAFFSHADCRTHDMGHGHPECPERLDAINDHLIASGIDIAVDRREAPLGLVSDIELAHSHAYVSELQEFLSQVAASGERRSLDPDTSCNAGTWKAALRAVGAAVAATDAVLDGQAANAFCAIRPPGHHATRGETMGF